jgi:tripartite-type tricarboxylate transporter receptor subunit TctC
MLDLSTRHGVRLTLGASAPSVFLTGSARLSGPRRVRTICWGRAFISASLRIGPAHVDDGIQPRRNTMIVLSRVAASIVISIAAAVAGIGSAAAADYPSRPVRWIVPYPPGGTTDVLARIMAQWLTEKTGQPFLVENRPGAGNNIGTEAVVTAAPDGYTMLLVNPAHGINASLYKKLSFNFMRDIVPVGGMVRTPNVMAVTNSLPVKTVAEFIAYCKANPGKVNMASSGSGTSTHLSGELFKSMTGCNMLHVPYKGAGPALTDLIGGQVQVFFDNLPSSAPHIKGNSIRALAMTSAAREPSMPDVPTIGDTVPGYEATAWFGIGMPKGSPREAIDRVNAEVNRALADPKMRARLAELGGQPIGGTPEEFGQVIAAETEKWAKVVASSGATVD